MATVGDARVTERHIIRQRCRERARGHIGVAIRTRAGNRGVAAEGPVLISLVNVSLYFKRRHFNG